MSPLLPPVDRPGFFMRIVYRIARHRYGKGPDAAARHLQPRAGAANARACISSGFAIMRCAWSRSWSHSSAFGSRRITAVISAPISDRRSRFSEASARSGSGSSTGGVRAANSHRASAQRSPGWTTSWMMEESRTRRSRKRERCFRSVSSLSSRGCRRQRRTSICRRTRSASRRTASPLSHGAPVLSGLQRAREASFCARLGVALRRC